MTDSDPREEGRGASSPFPSAYGSVRTTGGAVSETVPAPEPRRAGRRPLSEIREITGTRVTAADRRRLAKLANLESGSGEVRRPVVARERSAGVRPADSREGWERSMAAVPAADGATMAGPAGPSLMASTTVAPRPTIAPRRVPVGPEGPDPSGPQSRVTPRERGTPDWIARQIVESEAPDSDYELGPDRRWRRRKVTVTRARSSRRLVRRIDTWTVFKVSVIFYLLMLIVVLVAGMVTWSVAQHLGFVGDIQKSVRSLADDRKFILHGSVALKYAALGGVVLGLVGTLVNTVAAMLYNLLSDVFGGVQVIVISEPD